MGFRVWGSGFEVRNRGGLHERNGSGRGSRVMRGHYEGMAGLGGGGGGVLGFRIDGGGLRVDGRGLRVEG